MKLLLTERKANEIFKFQLNEAMREGFSFETLKQIPNYKQRLIYCQNYLGGNIGKGSSRIVFQIDDQWCLKLALNAKGIHQNNVENDGYLQKSGLFPQIDEKLSDYNNTWLVSEYVLPAKKEDFKHILGCSFEEVCKFIEQSASVFTPDIFTRRIHDRRDETYLARVEEYGFWSELDEYIRSYEIPVADLERIANWGMVNRDGEATMVILDSGFDESTAKLYNRR